MTINKKDDESMTASEPEYDIPIVEAVAEAVPDTVVYNNNHSSNPNATKLEEAAAAPPTANQTFVPYGAVDTDYTPPMQASTSTPKMELPMKRYDFGPEETWKNGLCSCCSVFFQPLFWVSLCCTPLLFGQLMTRMKLDWSGSPDPIHKGKQTFGIVAAIFVIYLVFNLFGVEFVCIAFLIYFLVIFTRTRGTIRRRFRIPAKNFRCCDGAMEDCCCGFWCGCCSGIQMARHTHDEDRYPYTACSTDGLPCYAPELPNMDGEDDATFTV